jgi:hypothetical protein
MPRSRSHALTLAARLSNLKVSPRRFGERRRLHADTRRELALWTGILAGPSVWFAAFGFRYSLASWACRLGWTPAVDIVSSAALAVAGAGGILCWTYWGRVGDGPAQAAAIRARTMAIGGVLVSAMSFLLILEHAAAVAMLGSCD